jgi:hypothetical protein
MIILTIHVNYMLKMKKQWNLGILIAASCVGGFFMLFLLYIWGTTVAMFQMIGVVNSREYKESLARLIQQTPEKMTQKRKNIATIASEVYHNQQQEMLAKDFYGVYRMRLRQI